jgi:amino acid adenylation domain-containing protein
MITNVLEYLEQTLARLTDPDKVAFYSTNTTLALDNAALLNENTVLSFKELSGLGKSCGSYLSQRGIVKQPVVVFMRKSPDMIAAFLGVVYGGNYYIPLDAEIPVFRIRLILEAVDPAMIICDEATSALVTEWKLPYPYESYNEIRNHPIDEISLGKIRKRAVDADPLYVVFTSGSTGTPKGVVASHRSVIDYIENLSAVLQVGPDTVFGNQSPLYLDACLKEIYPTLKFGATTYLIPQSLFMFPVKLIEYINENGINTICWVASALGMAAGLGALEVATPRTLHTVAFGSEVFPIKHFNLWREALPDARFIHLYGPTEATGMSCYYEAKRTFGPDESIPIGQPFPNTEIVLLDDNGNTPEQGQPGEICIRGAGLCLGYFGDAEKTAAVFTQNPQSVFPDTIYRTGDLGYVGSKGELYFLSRRDHQIKHMGHRIELAEIEWVAARCDGLGLACAVFDDVESKIILFYMAKDIKKTDVRAYLKSNLPRYMLPHTMFQLDDIPRTPGGKLDRVGLLVKYRQEKDRQGNTSAGKD